MAQSNDFPSIISSHHSSFDVFDSTKAPFVSIITFAVIGLAMFGVVDTNLSILTDQFTLCFLIIMGLFALSNVFLKFNRDRLVREPHVPLPIVLSALAIVAAAIAGNVTTITCHSGLLYRILHCRVGYDDVHWISRTTRNHSLLALHPK